MADYLSIIERAVNALPTNTAEARRVIYERARTALNRQLTSIQPAVSPAEISKQSLQLEEAIKAIEDKFAVPDQQIDETAAVKPEPSNEDSEVKPQAPEPAVEAAPESPMSEDLEAAPQASEETPPSADPEPAPIPATPDPDVSSPSIPEPFVQPASRAVPVKPPPAFPRQPSAIPSTEPEVEPEVKEPTSQIPEPLVETKVEPDDKSNVPEVSPSVEPIVSEAPAPVVSPPSSETAAPNVSVDADKKEAPEPLLPPVSLPEVDQALPAPSLSAQDKKETSKTGEAEIEDPLDTLKKVMGATETTPPAGDKPSDPASVTAQSPDDTNQASAIGAPEPSLPDTDFTDDASPEHQIAAKEANTRGGFGRGIGLLVVLLVIIGAGVFAWAQRDALGPVYQQIAEQIEGFFPEQAGSNGTSESVVSDNNATTEKDEDRLLTTPLPEDEPPTLVVPQETSEVDQPRVVIPEAPASLIPDPAIADAPPAAAEETDTAEQTPPPPANAAEAETAQTPEAPAPATNLFAATAILYEEQEGGTGRTDIFNGTITWEYVENGSAVVGAEGLPSVRGNARIPSRDMSVRFELMRNLDESLPASHLIELEFTPGQLSNDLVNGISAVTLKATEQERGRQIVGAGAKVSDRIFWLAMSSRAADFASNIDALKTLSWIDIPIIFQSGKRAILTLEKGNAGRRAIDQAFESWEAQ